MKAVIGGTVSKEELQDVAKSIARDAELEIEVDDSESSSRGGSSGSRIDMDDRAAAHWNRDI